MRVRSDAGGRSKQRFVESGRLWKTHGRVRAVCALGRLNLPVVAGFLVAGAVFGPEGVGLITDAGEIREFADIGVVLLLFGIGLEFSLERLRYIWRSVVVGGAFQVGLTALAVLSHSCSSATPWRAGSAS